MGTFLLLFFNEFGMHLKLYVLNFEKRAENIQEMRREIEKLQERIVQLEKS